MHHDVRRPTRRGTLPLPEIKFIPTAAENPGRPGPVELVFVHRWGVNDWHHEHMDGVLNGFKNPANKASSHLIYAGEHPAVGFRLTEWGHVDRGQHQFTASAYALPAGYDLGQFARDDAAPLTVEVQPLNAAPR